jgi:hypothetical protein
MDYIQTQWAADRGRITQEEAVRKIRRADERLRNDIDSIRNRSVQFIAADDGRDSSSVATTISSRLV